MKDSKGKSGRGGGKTRTLNLTLDVHLQDSCDEQLPGAVAYAYDLKGQLMATAHAPEKHETSVTFNLPLEHADRSIRVLMGPRVESHGAEDGTIPA